MARNARLCESLFLVRYIEKYGTGTLMMIRESVEHALPEPEFEQRGGEFVTTIWRDWLTEKVLAESALNERQRKAIGQIKITGRITSKEYQSLTGASPRTTTRDLDDLVVKSLLRKMGKTGRGAYYMVQVISDINRTNRPTLSRAKSVMNRPNRTSTTSVKGSREQADHSCRGQKRSTNKLLPKTRHKPDKPDKRGRK